MPFAYSYIGPQEIRCAARSVPPGRIIADIADLRASFDFDARVDGFTFVVALDGLLRLAPRRSEHVACAGGGDVLAAGELRFAETADGLRLIEASNQSTGYCPDVDCWDALASALRPAGIAAPQGFTRPITFRRCARCSEINLVKEQWFVCAFCDAELPREWNVSARRTTSR